MSLRFDTESNVIQVIGDTESVIEDNPRMIIQICGLMAVGPEWSTDFDTFNACAMYAENVNTVSKQEVRNEIIKALKRKSPAKFFMSAAEIGILGIIFPELREGVGVIQNIHHGYTTVWEHSIATLNEACPISPDPYFRLAALCHDIRKARSIGCNLAGETTFHCHDTIGTSMIYEWMKRLEFNNEAIRYVTKLIRHHQFHFNADTKDKAIIKWLRKVGKDTWQDLINLRIADRAGNIAKKDYPVITKELNELIGRIDNIIKNNPALFEEDLQVSGEDLKELGIKPGAIYKDIKDNLLGIVLQDPSKNEHTWLIDYIRRNYT